MVTPYLELTDCKVQVVSQYDHGPDSIIKNKIRNFIEAADPGFFQDGGVVIKMKRVQPAIAINQQYEKAKDQVRKNSFHNSLHVIASRYNGRGRGIRPTLSCPEGVWLFHENLWVASLRSQ